MRESALTLWDVAAPAQAEAVMQIVGNSPEPHLLAMRPYQQKQLNSSLEQFKLVRSTLMVSATGTGKTVTVAHLVNAMPSDQRVMFLAHREELITQACEKIYDVTGERPAIEMGEQWADQGRGKRRVIVSSIQTLVSKSRYLNDQPRMSRFNPADFSLVIVDEAHRAVAPTYRQVLNHFLQSPAVRVLGVTATPDRGDSEALGKVFESVAYRFPLVDAVKEGWLVPVRQTTVRITNLDLSKVKTTAGDLNGKELAEVLEFEKTLHEMATPVLEIAAGRQTLVFCASVAQAERFAEILNRHKPNCARHVNGKTPRDQRRGMFTAFGRKEFQVLVNVGVATEGTDIPGVEVVVMARPTKSRALYEQMLGRGTRPDFLIASLLNRCSDAEARNLMIERSHKPYMECVDFVGNAGKHKLITPADILGGDYSEKVRAKVAKKLASKSGKGNVPADIMELLRLTSDEIDKADALKAEADRLEEEARKTVKAAVEYRTKTVDPFDFYDVAPPVERKYDKLPPATDGQKRALEKYGIDASKTTRGAAGKLLDSLKGRITLGQMKVLKRAGYEQSEIKDLKLDAASRLIERVKDNNWKRPGDEPARELVGATEGVL